MKRVKIQIAVYVLCLAMLFTALMAFAAVYAYYRNVKLSQNNNIEIGNVEMTLTGEGGEGEVVEEGAVFFNANIQPRTTEFAPQNYEEAVASLQEDNGRTIAAAKINITREQNSSVYYALSLDDSVYDNNLQMLNGIYVTCFKVEQNSGEKTKWFHSPYSQLEFITGEMGQGEICYHLFITAEGANTSASIFRFDIKLESYCQPATSETIHDLKVAYDSDHATAMATYTYVGDTTEFEYRWFVTDHAADGEKIYLADQTGQTLPVIQSYKGWYLGVEVSNVNGTSAVFSAVSEEPCGGTGTRQLALDGDLYYNDFAYFADAQAQKADTQISVEDGTLVFTFGSVGATPVRLATSTVLSGGAKYRLSFDYSIVKANGSNPGTMLVQFMTGDVSQTRSMKIGSNTVIVNEDGSYHVDFVVTLLNAEGYYIQIGLQDGQNWAGAQFKVSELRIENISETQPDTDLSEAGDSVMFLQENGVAMSAANTKTEISVTEEEGEEIYEIRKTSVGQGALAVYFTGLTFETGTYTISFEYKNVGMASAPGPGVVQITSASNNAATVKAPNIPLGAGDHAKLNVWAATEVTLSISSELPADALLQFTTSAFTDRNSAVQLKNIVITKTA